MSYVFILLGATLAILFILQLKKGKQFDYIFETLEENAYPLKDLYGVGLSWSSNGPFKLKGKLEDRLITQASMLYEPRYAEYYANVAWAQTLTLVHLFLAGTFLMAGIMQKASSFMLLAGMLMCILIAAYCLENMKNTLSKRTEECEAELPEVVSTMAVLVNAGIVLREAWHMVANNNDGAFYDLMRKASEDMRNGASDAEAISLFGILSNSAEIRKFTSALLQSMEKGGAELSVFLANQSSELWNSKRQHMIQSGEKAATKLLLPIVLIFVGIIIIVMTAAFAGSLF